jgi:integrase
VLARRVQAHLHRFFRWSVGRGYIAANPMADMEKVGTAVERDRVLTDAELAVVWNAVAWDPVSKAGWPFAPAIRLLILTGARREEMAALRWAEIVGDRIELAGARTKNEEPHHIPLVHSAAASSTPCRASTAANLCSPPPAKVRSAAGRAPRSVSIVRVCPLLNLP